MGKPKNTIEEDKIQVENAFGSIERLKTTIQISLESTNALLADLKTKRDFYDEQIKRSEEVRKFCCGLLGLEK